MMLLRVLGAMACAAAVASGAARGDEQADKEALTKKLWPKERIEAALKTFPQTTSSMAMIGRAEKGETADVNYMEILVNLKPHDQWPQAISFPDLSREMQDKLEQVVPTAVISATQPIQMRVEELISGVRATLALKLYGEDLTTLDRLSGELKSALEKVPGVADLSLEANKGKPQMVVKVNRDEAARYGINADEILEVVQAGIGGKAVSTLIDGVKRFDIQVWLAPDFRNSVEAINNIPIRTQSGALVPLSKVATVELDEADNHWAWQWLWAPAELAPVPAVELGAPRWRDGLHHHGGPRRHAHGIGQHRVDHGLDQHGGHLGAEGERGRSAVGLGGDGVGQLPDRLADEVLPSGGEE